jgi:CRISPR/Cas system Type II protein with McrA/HNH and RuvC-like nuclease domain
MERVGVGTFSTLGPRVEGSKLAKEGESLAAKAKVARSAARRRIAPEKGK